MTGQAVSNRAAQLEPQQIRRLFDLASEHDADDLVHLELGEPDFATPEHVVEAAVTAARNGETNYTPNAGIDPLRRAIADQLQAHSVDARDKSHFSPSHRPLCDGRRYERAEHTPELTLTGVQEPLTGVV